MKTLRALLLILMTALILLGGQIATARVLCPQVIWIDPVTGKECHYAPSGNTCKSSPQLASRCFYNPALVFAGSSLPANAFPLRGYYSSESKAR